MVELRMVELWTVEPCTVELWTVVLWVAGTVCAGAASADPKSSAVAQIGRLTQPKPVVNSIVLPRSLPRADECLLTVQNCGGKHDVVVDTKVRELEDLTWQV